MHILTNSIASPTARNMLSALAVGTILCSPLSAYTEEQQHLLGSWAGVRDWAALNGLELEAVLTSDIVGTMSGGIRRDAVTIHNLDLTATLDTSEADMWEHGTIYLYALGNYGKSGSELSGETQVASNIEAPDNLQLFEAWYEHTISRGSLLFGLHDYNSEFDTLGYSSTLLNSSFGIGVDIAQVAPSIFPTTSLAVRLLVKPEDNSYVRLALYDGVPGDPDRPRGTHIELKESDGFFYAAEAGMISSEEDLPFKIALGGWYHTAEFDDVRAFPRSSNYGLYLNAESSLLPEENSTQGLGAFLRFGTASASRNQVKHQLSAGLHYTGLFPSRDDDTIAIGFARATNSDAYVAETAAQRSETVVELSYRAVVTPYFVVQPDLQYIHNPGTDRDVKDALVGILRTEIAF